MIIVYRARYIVNWWWIEQNMDENVLYVIKDRKWMVDVVEFFLRKILGLYHGDDDIQ